MGKSKKIVSAWPIEKLQQIYDSEVVKYPQGRRVQFNYDTGMATITKDMQTETIPFIFLQDKEEEEERAAKRIAESSSGEKEKEKKGDIDQVEAQVVQERESSSLMINEQAASILKSKYDEVMRVVRRVQMVKLMKMEEELLKRAVVALKRSRIVFWKIIPKGDDSMFFNLVVQREEGEEEIYDAVHKVFKKMTRDDLTDMLKIGKANHSGSDNFFIIEVLEVLTSILEPSVEKIKKGKVKQINIFDKPMVYRLRFADGRVQYFAFEFFDHSREVLEDMKNARVVLEVISLEKKLKDAITMKFRWI